MLRWLGCEVGDLRVLSIGTAGAAPTSGWSSRAPGLVEWLVRRGLVQLTLSAQEQLAVDQCGVLLGERYLRLDHAPRSGGSAVSRPRQCQRRVDACLAASGRSNHRFPPARQDRSVSEAPSAWTWSADPVVASRVVGVAAPRCAGDRSRENWSASPRRVFTAAVRPPLPCATGARERGGGADSAGHGEGRKDVSAQEIGAQPGWSSGRR